MTICAHHHQHIFGSVGATGGSPAINNPPESNETSKIILNQYGKIVKYEWMQSEKIRDEIQLDEFIIMPNHIHGIIQIIDGNDFYTGDHVNTGDHMNAGDQPVAPTTLPSKSIGSMIAGFKSMVTKRINLLRNTPRMPVWQRNYYEHVIRDENDLNRIREYIITNPEKWGEDKYNNELP